MFAASHKGLPAELAKFASVGVLNTVLGLVIIYALKWGLHWGDVSANLAGYAMCIFLGFVLNGRWTFWPLGAEAQLPAGLSAGGRGGVWDESLGFTGLHPPDGATWGICAAGRGSGVYADLFFAEQDIRFSGDH